jgi:hypothetical protein
MRRRFYFASLALGLLALAAVPALAAPESQPASAPAEIDPNGPRMVAREYAKALSAGDVAGARKLARCSDQNLLILRTMANFMTGMQAMADAMNETFGDARTMKLDQITAAFGGWWEQADETITDNTAVLRLRGDPGASMVLVKMPDGWKVDVDNMPDLAGLQKVLPRLNALGNAARDVATAIRDKSCKSATEAKALFNSRLLLADTPTTRSSENPADE